MSPRADRSALDGYPPPPAAVGSESHDVRVLGTRVFVERYAGVSYARFAMRGPVRLKIEGARPITNFTIFPVERVASARVDGNVLRFDLRTPDSVVVWIDGLEKLFVLPDPLDDDAPRRGSPGVLDVIDHGADPTGRLLATTTLQDAIDAATSLRAGGTVVIRPAFTGPEP